MKFFDFYAGIGGGRIALENNGFTCVGHCEIDDKAARTYQILYDDRNYGDLIKVDINKLPDFDFLIAGFPCQDYSVARSLSNEKGIEGKKGVLF